MLNKITIIGAGRVGETTAQMISIRDLCSELVLLDIREGAAAGAALDIQESAELLEFDTELFGGTDFSMLADSDLIVITAGLPRKEGMSRSDLLNSNAALSNSIVDNVMQYAPDSMMLFVTNPVDVITYNAWKRTGWSSNRIMGQAGVLDSSRMASFISMETGYSSQDISPMVLGGHGDTMVPMLRYTTIAGIPVSNFISEDKLEEIVERTRNGGAEVIALKKISSAYNAPAAATAEMIDAIANDRKLIMPTVCILEGQYGHDELAIGVPAVLGKDGVEEIISLELNEEETRQFNQSVGIVKADIALLDAE